MVSKHALADFLGDRVVYRNLEPADPSLPALGDVWQEVGLDSLRVPRKTEPAWAAVVMRLLQAAQAARGKPPLENLLFIGDTLMNDGTAARNMAVHLPLRGFIGADRLEEQERVEFDGPLMMANRWQRLADLPDWGRAQGLACDERTAVLVDIDKTFIGARGRNDAVIDRARVAAVRQTVEELLAARFDEEALVAIYNELIKPQYHPFTTDNQDYVAYICLMVAGNVFPAAAFWAELEAEHLSGFVQFVTLCDARLRGAEEGVALAHREVIANVRRGDPTPFKSFRNREYFATVARMDCLPDDASRAELLAGEILVTAEVAEVVRWYLDKGALTFGISDKPDEASLPPPSPPAEGQDLRPIHRVIMKVVGGN